MRPWPKRNASEAEALLEDAKYESRARKVGFN